MRIVAVDWSGSRNPTHQRRHIWRADAVDGEVVSLGAGRTRDELVADLIGTAAEEPNGLVVGLDFAFSLPGWYLEKLGLDGPGLWAQVATEALTPRMRTLGLAGWLADPEAPFWASSKPPETTGRAFRRTELELATPGIQLKSVFQLVGAGQVGPGSLYGMQALHRLSEAGFAIWPFDDPTFPLIVEIYPRVLIGRESTKSEIDRRAYLAALPVDPSLRALATASVDAFDALVSAVRMAEHAHELRRLAVRPDDLPEGRIWTQAAAAAATAMRSETAVAGDYVAAWNEEDRARAGLDACRRIADGRRVLIAGFFDAL